MSKISIDPRITVQAVADGEVHILFSWTEEDLISIAQAFIAVTNGKIKAEDVKMAFRLRNKEGIDYLIQRLQEERRNLYGNE